MAKKGYTPEQIIEPLRYEELSQRIRGILKQFTQL